jgi:nitrite reductase/ring-hydroxylating ferredoxin subunit/uncharacterized membrane protein
MKSKANIKGHPLHPILIAFPVAFFTGTLIFDILGYANSNANYWQTGKYLEIAGLIGGLIAAVPGLIDYIYTVPPDSSAKKRATQHAIINVLMLLFFASALYFRENNAHEFSFKIILHEIIGTILMGVAGWMGGTLVNRNHISIDIRYAGAGKWQEMNATLQNGQVEAAKSNELKIDQMKLIHVNGKRIVLTKSEKGYSAFDDRCPHKGGSLAGGIMICGTVQCPWHGSQFDTHTGACKAGPAEAGIKTYSVNETDGKVYIKL